MKRIIPYLWFDKEALEAAEFYVSVFPDARVTRISHIHDTPSGDCDIAAFELAGYAYQAISAGPYFTINPSVSFMLNFDPGRDTDARQHLDDLWENLSRDGEMLMPLDTYPFSKRYGWVKDRYGVSWQLILTNPGGEERPFIVPSLLFTGDVTGRAGEAIDFYTSVFKHARRGISASYPEGMDPNMEGNLMFADFMIEGQWFAAMDDGRQHDFGFNEAVSFYVACETQEEIDYYWERLSAVPEAEQCGWLKDKYGVSWQITPEVLETMMREGDREQIDRVTRAFLRMKKFDISVITRTYENR